VKPINQEFLAAAHLPIEAIRSILSGREEVSWEEIRDSRKLSLSFTDRATIGVFAEVPYAEIREWIFRVSRALMKVGGDISELNVAYANTLASEQIQKEKANAMQLLTIEELTNDVTDCERMVLQTSRKWNDAFAAYRRLNVRPKGIEIAPLRELAEAELAVLQFAETLESQVVSLKVAEERLARAKTHWSERAPCGVFG
jgi:cob(I)alamin adenosyltransferase